MSLSQQPETKAGSLSPDRNQNENRVQVERAGSPVFSCISMKSDCSMDPPWYFKGESTGHPRVQVERAGSPVFSCISMKSDNSMDPPWYFKGESTGHPRVLQSEESSCSAQKSLEMFTSTTKSLLRTLMKLKKNEKLKTFRSHLNQDCPECCRSLSDNPALLEKFLTMKELLESHEIHDYPECSESEQGDPEVLYIVEKILEACGSERSMKITLHILRNMKQKDLADSLERDECFTRGQQALKTDLKKRFECIFEGLANYSQPTPLNEIYTELYITEGGTGEVNYEHEVRQIEMASRRQTRQEVPILYNDIFNAFPGQKKPRTVLTKGIAGIGKTVSVQKFILDWAEGKANQDVDFIFILPFRDLNVRKEVDLSLMHLLHCCFPQLRGIESIEGGEVKVVFIFDGLDECRLPLHFQSNKVCCDVTEPSSVDVLLTNLIQGNLLPSALVWITSRPAAANQIPPECVHRVTEVRGFNDRRKEEYFGKRIRDQNLASSIISHIKASRSLYIMCHIPVFCWISATVLEAMLGETESGDLPRTLTEMYTHFLLIQTDMTKLKYRDNDETAKKQTSMSDSEIILKLGRLAFLQLKKGNLIFYEEDLRESGIDVSEASVYSGVCTEIFKEECGLYQEKVYSFVHLSIQEYLAALFAFYTCVNENRNVLKVDESKPHTDWMQLSELHTSAVDQALESKNGHLDLFLRFLLGLSLDSIQALLGRLLTESEARPQNIEKTVQYVKMKIREESSAERTINLFHCLNELNDNSLVEEIQNSLRSGKLSEKELEPHQCSALAFVLLMSEEILEEFDLKTYNASAAGHQRLVPIVRNCKKAVLDNCDLTEKSCDIVASALQSPNSPLRDLDLSCNNLGDSGVELLCAGLMSPNCKVQRVGLGWCNLTEGCCDLLASVLRSPHSALRDLELRDNDVQDSGVRALSAGLEDSHCKLERLGLSGCGVTERGCDSLASALCSNPSHLRELDLSYNHPGDSGVQALSAAKPDTLTLLVDHGGENRTKAGPRKYGCRLTLDANSANRKLSVSEGKRKVAYTGRKETPYPDHPDRFDFRRQLLSSESLEGRSYWEAEFSMSEKGGVHFAVAHRGICRKERGHDSEFGWNRHSWSLWCSKHSYSIKRLKNITLTATPRPCGRVYDRTARRRVCVYRVGVFVDLPAGILAYYSLSGSDTPTLLHRFRTQFTEHTPLCAGFAVFGYPSWLSLLQPD